MSVGRWVVSSVRSFIWSVEKDLKTFSNYWMRLSRIWNILQVEESVIHRIGQRLRWITPSEICRILHILRTPNSIIALLFIQNIFFAQTCKLYLQPFLSFWMTQPFAQVFSVNGSIIFDVNGPIICSGLHFWRHWFNMTKFLVNSSCLWWFMHVVLTNQKRGNILNE